MITYRTGNDLDLDQVIALYIDSTLGERRPVADRERMRLMLANANLVVTAWDGAVLVGISRALSDFAFTTYLSDLAVRLAYQRQGIGVELIRRTRDAAGPQTSLVLLSAPAAEQYYPRIGMKSHHSAWWIKAGEAF
jgi:predicted N-acetyltransferase YhbS